MFPPGVGASLRARFVEAEQLFRVRPPTWLNYPTTKSQAGLYATQKGSHAEKVFRWRATDILT